LKKVIYGNKGPISRLESLGFVIRRQPPNCPDAKDQYRLNLENEFIRVYVKAVLHSYLS